MSQVSFFAYYPCHYLLIPLWNNKYSMFFDKRRERDGEGGREGGRERGRERERERENVTMQHLLATVYSCNVRTNVVVKEHYRAVSLTGYS